MKKHLFVVAHPDDEVLGAGAFIYDSTVAGDESYVLTLNTVDTTRYEDDLSGLKADMSLSHKILGVKEEFGFTYLDSNFHNADHRTMVQDIESVIRKVQPDDIFTQHPGDVNTDHYWCAASCMEAFHLWQRGREDLKPVEALYLFEVQSSTDWALNPSINTFKPNTYVGISQDGLEWKIEALKCYENVVRPMPHPRSEEALRALPILRGSQSGMLMAEAFECVFRRGV